MAALPRITVSTRQRQGQVVALTPEQRHYLVKVLRLQEGDRFIALDETDCSWLAELGEGCSACIIALHSSLEQATTELTCEVTLQVAMPKTGMEDIIRQTTELGVYSIQPVISDRVILKPSAHKQQRWQRVAQEAAEQSERQHWPRIGPACKFAAATKLPVTQAPRRYIGVARRQAVSLLIALQNSPPAAALVVATGPEGGWTAAEIEAAIAAGYQPVRLGNRILRAVTAPVVAMALVAAVYERLD
ncbi:MAG: 16S rRNA (uracil(1498)-N(3))-methyltransferase [Cyanobacteria bacterium P01_A01_bin.135]